MANWQSHLKADPIPWLLDQEDPWVRYRTRLDLLDQPDTGPETASVRAEMIAHPKVQTILTQAAAWPDYPITRHNDANHPIHKLTILADLGLNQHDPGMDKVIAALLKHQAPEGAFESLVLIPKAFGGTDEEMLSWMLCDTPTITHALVRYGLGNEPTVVKALDHMAGLQRENGWPCACSPEFGNFRGPGKKEDACPYANLITLKALAAAPGNRYEGEIQRGVEMLLDHWTHQEGKKKYLFGIGTTYRRLKYPFIWYDILHILETLSTIPAALIDPRTQEILAELLQQQDEQGQFKPSSIWMAWKGWGFGQKREPSAWITLLAARIIKRFYEK